ncbi:MAG: helix-turn-helix transcriptional regulator [Lentisphaeria bacterium]|nr:helix-turn-helix transcriptional regulator [Lentisphaeria bacterium]
MASSVLWLENLPRKLNTLPHLRTLEHWQDFQLNSGKCNSLQFCFRLSGNNLQKLQLKIDGVFHEVGFPHLMIKYPGQDIEFLNVNSADVFYFSYQPEAEAFFARCGLPGNFYIAEISLPESLPQVMELLKNSRNHLNEPGCADKLDLACYTLVHEAMLSWTAKQTELNEVDKKILNIASYLQTHYTEKCDIDKLSTHYGFSRRNFLRYWEKLFHCPPGSYLNKLKLLEAKRMLKETTLPLSEIATRLGFCDDGYFCRFFRRNTGMTPRSFREK